MCGVMLVYETMSSEKGSSETSGPHQPNKQRKAPRFNDGMRHQPQKPDPRLPER